MKQDDIWASEALLADCDAHLSAIYFSAASSPPDEMTDLVLDEITRLRSAIDQLRGRVRTLVPHDLESVQ